MSELKSMNLFGRPKETPTLKILSIDFDVFYDLGKNFRPSIQQCMIDWVINYNTNSDTMKRTFYYDLYGKIKDKIRSASQTIYVSEDHSYIGKIIAERYPDFALDIVNYDRHCDLSQRQLKTSKLTSANWVGWLADRQVISNYDWVCWSNDYYEGEMQWFIDDCRPEIKQFPINRISNKFHRLDEAFDFIFVIQSHEYSPPHMYHRFRELYEDLTRVVFDKQFPIWDLSYEESVERLKILDSVQFVRDEISPYTGETVSAFIDPNLGDDYRDGMEDDEDSLVFIQKNMSREYFIKMFGECDLQYAD